MKQEALAAQQALAVETPPLSQVERVGDTFVVPSKTFTDVRRSASWWLPFLLLVLGGFALTAAIQTKVGWAQVAENELRSNAKLTEQLGSLPPDQMAATQHRMRLGFQYGFYAGPLISLVSLALMSLVLWPTINFAFAGSARYGEVLCVAMYAALPGVLSALLAAVLLFAGARSPETFTTQTMIGSNAGYYLETPGALKTLLTSMDLFSIWTAVLMSIGLSIVARTKASAGYITVFGWWILIVLIKTGYAALNS